MQPPKVVLPYDNPAYVAAYKRIDTIKRLSDREKLLAKQQWVVVSKKIDRLTKKWAIEFELRAKFEGIAEDILSLALKNKPGEIITKDMTSPGGYSQNFASQITIFSKRVAGLSTRSKFRVDHTILVNSNKILYKFFYYNHDAEPDKRVGQINILFDRCVSLSRCTNIKIFDGSEMDSKVYKPRTLEQQLND